MFADPVAYDATPEEAARTLTVRRAELRSVLDRRHDARLLSALARDEVVDEAISVVARSTRPIRDEQHLEGAFWTAVGPLIGEWRTGPPPSIEASPAGREGPFGDRMSATLSRSLRYRSRRWERSARVISMFAADAEPSRQERGTEV